MGNIAELNANIIQYRQLNPLTLKLSELAEKESIERDNTFFGRSKNISRNWAIVSFLAGVLVSWGFSHYYDNNKDKNLIEFETRLNTKLKMFDVQDSLNKHIKDIELISEKQNQLIDSLNIQLNKKVTPKKISNKTEK